MSEEQRNPKPPYVPWGTFINFINGLEGNLLPAVIDRSLVLSLSGGVQSILLTALRTTGMIDNGGVPTDRLRQYLSADEQTRKNILRLSVEESFPFLFDGSIDLTTTTPAKFDERLREAGGLSGSTLDKAASFFLSAAEHTEIELGVYLQKRKPSGRKSAKPRKAKENGTNSASSGSASSDARGPIQPISEKALEYRLVDLMSEAADNEEVLEAIWVIVRFLKARNKLSEGSEQNSNSAQTDEVSE